MFALLTRLYDTGVTINEIRSGSGGNHEVRDGNVHWVRYTSETNFVVVVVVRGFTNNLFG